MRFTKAFWPGIADGTVTVAFRRWARPTVVAGRPYRTGGGRIEVLSVDVVDPAAISDAEAARAGHASAAEVRAQLRGDPADPVHRVVFRRLDEPDRASGHGPWTRPTLRLIARHPGVRAPDLAASVGRDTRSFKLDVRKLKNLGLTHSLRVGYRLSPRGRAYLDQAGHRAGGGAGDGAAQAKSSGWSG